MFDQLFSRTRTADTGVGVHGDGSSDLPISNCISGELGGVGMSIGLISVVPTRSEPEEEASSSQTPTRSFTASGFLAAIFGIGIALSFWTPKNLWVFIGGFGLRREKRRQRNQQNKRTIEAREEVTVRGDKLTSGQKDKGKERAIDVENEGESSASNSGTERTPLLVGAESTYSTGISLRDSGISLANSEETRATRSEELPIHHSPPKSLEPEIIEDEMLETIDEAEEVEPPIELPANQSWSFADHSPSPTPSVRAESPAPQVEEEGSMVIIPPGVQKVEDPNACPYDRRKPSVEPLPASVAVDLPVASEDGLRESRSLTPVRRAIPTQSPASSVRSRSLSRGVSTESVLGAKGAEKVEVPAKFLEEVEAGPSVSEIVEVPRVEEVEVPKAVEIEAPRVEAPKVEAPKFEEIVTPKIEEAIVIAPKDKEIEIPTAEVRSAAVEEVVVPKIEEVEVPKPKEVETPKVESPKPQEVEAPKPKEVEAPKAEAPKVEAPKIETPKVEAAKVESPKVEAVKVESPKVESPKVEAPKVESPKVETPKVEKVIEEPKEEKKEEEQEVKSTPVAIPSPPTPTPQIDLIPPTPAFNSGFSKEVVALLRPGQAEGDEDEADNKLKENQYHRSLSGSTEALPQLTEEPEPVPNTLEVDHKGKGRADDDISIIDHPMSTSPDQISLSDEQKEDTQKDESHPEGLSPDEIPRPVSAKPSSILGDDKSTRSESGPARKTSFRRMAGISSSSSHSRAASIDSKKDSSLRRSLTAVFPGKKMKRENSAPASASSSQVKLGGELTPPPTPPETSQDVARPESRRSEKEKEKSSISRAMSWNHAINKLSSKEKREQAKQSSDHEAGGKSEDGADTTETTKPLKSSSASIISHKEGRPRTSDGKSIKEDDRPSKLPRRATWVFGKKKSSQNLGLKAASAGASSTSLAGPKNDEIAQPAEVIASLDKGKGVDRSPVQTPKPAEAAPEATKDVKIIEAPPAPSPPAQSSEQEQKQLADEAAAAAAAVIAEQKPAPRPMLKSRVTSMMAWGRKKK